MSGAAGIFITREELDLLYGLPGIAVRLYYLLRTLMNFMNGTVGVSPHVSWYSLSTGLYVEPRPGLRGGQPSAQQMRRACVHLVDAGLVRMRSNMVQRQLIFFLPVARLGFFVPNKADSKPTDKADRPLQRGKQGKADRDAMTKADTYLCSVSKNYNRDSGSSTPYTQAVDNLIESGALDAPEGETIKAAIQRLSHVESAPQTILDELAGAIEKGAVRNKVAFVIGLIKRFEQGTFKPDKGIAIAARRAKSTQAQSKGTGEPADVPKASKAVARAAIATAKSQLSKGGRNGRQSDNA